MKMYRQTLVGIQNINFYANLSCGTRGIPCGKTWRS